MPVSVQCPNPKCHASFHIAPGDASRFRRCPQCGWDLVADPESGSSSSLIPDPNQLGALDEDRPPPRSTLDPLIGETIAGRYTILQILGRGGMGAVYLATDARLGGRKVAVKVPTLSDEHDAAFLKRIEREAHIAAQFQHPNICPIHDVGTHDGRPFLVLAYIEGTSLAAHLDRRTKPFDVVQAVKLVYVVARALDEAHATGIIHRDLKPDNIMLTREGRPIVMDFGLAKRTDSGEKLTSAGNAFGTPAYMPLEQFRDVGAIDHRADIYSLGVTLYQLLTGQLPYRGTLYQIMGALLTANPTLPPSELRPEVDPELESICLKAMAREAADRYGSMREFAEALVLWLKRTTGRESVMLRQDPPPVEIRPSEVVPPGAPSPVRSEAGPQPFAGLSLDPPLAPKKSRPSRLSMGRRVLVAIGLSGLMLPGIIVYLATGGSRRVEREAPPFRAEMAGTGSPTAPPAPAPPVPPPTWTSRSTRMTLALIPAGNFEMGAADGESDEKPPHPVTISEPFYLGIHEVTQAEYKAVMGTNPSYFSAGGGGKDDVAGQSTDRYPVEQVSWNDAIAFCNELSKREGLTPYYRSDEGEPVGGDGYRLPTEAEWEFACRARSTTKFSFGDVADRLNQYAWYAEDSNGKTHPAGQKLPNAFGLYDMHGNVWEWCFDWYYKDYYNKSSNNDPMNTNPGNARVLRGGAWGDTNARGLRSSYRFQNGAPPSNRFRNNGFRIARSCRPGAPPAPRPAPPAPPPTWTSRSTGIAFALIPAGDFVMGADDGMPDEKPPHSVTISRPFYLGIHEVTQAEYEQLMGNNPSWFSASGLGKDKVSGQSTDRHPVERMSWNDAIAFCNKLSERDGLKPYYRSDAGEPIGGDGYRLPTEAEWEYACRARSTTRYSFGDEAASLDEYAWYGGNSGGQTHPVGQKKPNTFGLYDMHGNVWEWCWDWFDKDYYNKSSSVDPINANPDTGHVLRGGSWSEDGGYHHSFFRIRIEPTKRYWNMGFRPARNYH
jgi:formylglycine-generating enzyme required for sulfatase activity/predicted Ser/Thr protein kinase